MRSTGKNSEHMTMYITYGCDKILADLYGGSARQRSLTCWPAEATYLLRKINTLESADLKAPAFENKLSATNIGSPFLF